MRRSPLSGRGRDLAERVVAARRSFDLAFAEPRREAEAARVSALSIEAGGDVYVVRLASVGGVHVDRPLTRLPGETKAFLGVVALGPALVPAWDLRVLLGYAPPPSPSARGGPPAEAPRWLMTVKEAGLALAFDSCAGAIHPPASDFAARGPSERGSAHVRELVRWGGGLLPVLDVESVLAAIRSLARPVEGRKER